MKRKDGSEIWVEDHGYYVHDERGNIVYHEGMMRDVTERKRIENALEESERRLRIVTDHMLDMVVRCDLRGIFEYVSPSHRMLGYAPEELAGKSIFELIHPDDQEGAMNAFLKGVETRSPQRVELRFKHADGHYVWLESVGNPTFDEKSEINGAIIGSRDITERRKMQAELEKYTKHLEELVEERTRRLREGEERTRAILNATTAVLVVADRLGTIVDANRAFCEALRVSPESVIGRNIFELLAEPDVLADRRNSIENVFFSGNPVRIEDKQIGRAHV